MLIDSHSHLNFKDHFPDLDEVKQAMSQNGVEAAIVVGVDIESSANAIAMANEWLFPSAGIHPQEDGFTETDEEWKQLEELLAQSTVVAIGETGLDYFHERVPHEVQKKRFIRHLHYARESQLPVIVHCRDQEGNREASEHTKQLIKSEGVGTKGVLHCFAGDMELGQFALDQGWAISMAGNLTFKKAEDLRDSVRNLNGDHFLVETDCPFLTPHPHRGKKNAPAMVKHTAEVLGQIKGWNMEQTIQKTRQSTIELFQLPLR